MRFAYYTPSSFRTLNAGALRNAAVARALVLAGHEVKIICGDGDSEDIDSEWAHLLGDRVVVHPGGPRGRRSLLRGRVGRLLGGPTTQGTGAARLADHVIAYNPDPVMWARLRRSSRQSGVPLTVDMTEWLGARDIPGGWWTPFGIWYEVHLRTLPYRIDRGVAISSRMAAHLRRGGAPVLVVPPLHEVPPFDMGHIRHDSSSHLLISGGDLNPSGKDGLTLRLLLGALRVDPALASAMHVHVAGNVAEAGEGLIDELRKHVKTTFHGWIPREEFLALLSSVDYLLLLRESRSRRIEYGFPSKVTESLLVGTPVVANEFSDMGQVLRTGSDWMPVDALTTQALLSALRHAFSVSVDRSVIAQDAAGRFTPSAFSAAIADFIAGVAK